ncbi:hypothetical protein FGB62_119g010 [Gracilaria domingensis]|nr:hypothetical protein FGB62_119g010 [Gracilaria domingensis]
MNNDRLRVHCVSGTDRVLYRIVEGLPPFVDPPPVEEELDVRATPVYRTNLTLQVVRDEGPFHAFAPWPGLEEDKPDTMYTQIKNVTVLDAEDMECFQWRMPIPEDIIPILRNKAYSFVCQNVTGSVADFYFASIGDMTNEDNTGILSQEGDLISKQFTVSTTFNFLGSLEFKDKILINAGNIIRRLLLPPPNTSGKFPINLRMLVYSRATNVTVEVPGSKEAHSVELDVVVMVVGAGEVLLILLLGMMLGIYSQYNWKGMPRANTVDGLSYLWAQSVTAWWDGSFKKTPITLRLTRRTFDGKERFMYAPVDMESGESSVDDHSSDNDSSG